MLDGSGICFLPLHRCRQFRSYCPGNLSPTEPCLYVLTHTAGPTPLGQTVTQNGNNIRATVNFSFTKDDHGVVDFVAVRASKINSAQHALMASAKSFLFKPDTFNSSQQIETTLFTCFGTNGVGRL